MSTVLIKKELVDADENCNVGNNKQRDASNSSQIILSEITPTPIKSHPYTVKNTQRSNEWVLAQNEHDFARRFYTNKKQLTVIPGAKCGEIFVTNNSRRWTFICTFCSKSTRDIGEFICHIRLKHLMGGRSPGNESLINDDEDDNFDDDYSVRDNAYDIPQQNYLDCGNYLDLNVHTDSEELIYTGQVPSKELVKPTNSIEYKSQTDILPPIKKKVLTDPHSLETLKGNYKRECTNDATTVEDEIMEDDEDLEETSELDNENDLIKINISETNSHSQPVESSIKLSKEVTGSISRNFKRENCEINLETECIIDKNESVEAYKQYDQEHLSVISVSSCNEPPEQDNEYGDQLLIRRKDSEDYTGELKAKRTQIRGTAYCSLCKKTFQYYSLYRNHMIKHSNETPFKCVLCEKGFKSKQAIRYHLSTHQKEKKYKCSLCQSRFYTENQFTTHVLTHENKNTFPCSVCGLIFPTDEERNGHIKSHTKERPFRCKFCKKLFRLRHHLSNHLKMHRQYRCDFCKNEFTSSVNLRKPYACIGCETEVKCNEVKDNFLNDLPVNPLQLIGQATPKAEIAEMVSDSEDSDEDDDGENDFDDSDAENSDAIGADNIVECKRENYVTAHSQINEKDSHNNKCKQKRFNCDYCSRTYSHSSGLNYHLRTKHSQ